MLGQDPRRLRDLPRYIAKLLRPGDVYDERIIRWPPLDGKDASDGLGIEGIGAKSVDRLRRKGDKPPTPEHGSRSFDHIRLRRFRSDAHDFGLDFRLRRGHVSDYRSTTMATASPPPMQSVTRPRRACRRFSS